MSVAETAVMCREGIGARHASLHRPVGAPPYWVLHTGLPLNLCVTAKFETVGHRANPRLVAARHDRRNLSICTDDLRVDIRSGGDDNSDAMTWTISHLWLGGDLPLDWSRSDRAAWESALWIVAKGEGLGV